MASSELKELEELKDRVVFNKGDFANLSFLGQALGSDLSDSVTLRLGISDTAFWASLQGFRRKVQELAKDFRRSRRSHFDVAKAIALLTDLSFESVEEEVAPSDVSATILPLTEDPNAKHFIKLCAKLLDVLAMIHLVPKVYAGFSSSSHSVLARMCFLLFELGAVGQRQGGGKQSILSGHPGIGKTTMMLYIAAIANVCFPDILTVYYTWETPLYEYGRPLPPEDPSAVKFPPPTVQQIVGAALTDPRILADANGFMKFVCTYKPTIATAQCGKCIVFLGDELQTVYETSDAYEASAVAIVQGLRDLGKSTTAMVCLAGSSTRMHEYALTPSSALRAKGFVDLNHGTYEVIHVQPPRTLTHMREYLSKRFEGYPVDAEKVLYLSGGIGRSVGNIVLLGLTPTTPPPLLQAVQKNPALYALFVRFSGILPPDLLQKAAKTDEEVVFDVVSVSYAIATQIVAEAGEEDPCGFLAEMQARGVLYITPEYSVVQPMRPQDVTNFLRLLKSAEDPRTLLCLCLLLAQQKHTSFYDMLEALIRDRSHLVWTRIRSSRTRFFHFHEGSLYVRTTRDLSAPSELVTLDMLRDIAAEGAPICWIGEQGIDITALEIANESATAFNVHFCQVKTGGSYIVFGGGSVEAYAKPKAVTGESASFAPMLEKFRRGADELLPRLSKLFPAAGFTPCTFKLLTNKGWGNAAEECRLKYSPFGLSDGAEVELEPPLHGAEWLINDLLSDKEKVAVHALSRVK